MKYLATIAVLVALAVAGCASGGTTTVVQQPTTAATSSSQPSESDQQFMDQVIAQKPDEVVQLCHLNSVDSTSARLGFAKGYGTPINGISAYEVYDYIVSDYC